MLKLRAKVDIPDLEWMAHLDKDGFTVHTFFDQGQYEGLKRKLLEVAGFAVVLPRIEEDKTKIMSRGIFLRGYNAFHVRGEKSRCHFNVARLWDSNRTRVKIMTGYALSRDGVWRQHSWGLFDDRPVETTCRRVLYYGFMMYDDEAENFFYDNGM